MAFDLDEKFLIQAEQELNILQFPVSYRNAMMNNNGGFFEYGAEDSAVFASFELYPIADNSDRKRLSRTINNVVKETKSIRENDDFLENFIQIGDDGGAGAFYFKINDDRSVDDLIWYRMWEEDELAQVCKFSDGVCTK